MEPFNFAKKVKKQKRNPLSYINSKFSGFTTAQIYIYRISAYFVSDSLDSKDEDFTIL
jgi:hypothetical protein